MLPFIVFCLSLVYSCTQNCKLYCAYHSPTALCLSSCSCQLTSSSPLASISQYSTWNCSYSIIDACNYSVDFDSCMRSAGCAYLPSSDLPSNKIPDSQWHHIKTLKPFSNPGLKASKLVVCSDCKIFEGDDYWACISEYCSNFEVEGFSFQVKGRVGGQAQAQLTVGVSFGNSLCCVDEQGNEGSKGQCVSQCEILDEDDFLNMRKMGTGGNSGFSDGFVHVNSEPTQESGMLTYPTAYLLLASAGLLLYCAIKPSKNTENLNYKLLI